MKKISVKKFLIYQLIAIVICAIPAMLMTVLLSVIVKNDDLITVIGFFLGGLSTIVAVYLTFWYIEKNNESPLI